MRSLTRRQSIAALLGGSAIGLLGLGWTASHETDLVRTILERAVGPFSMPEEDFSSFVGDLDASRGRFGDAKLSLYRAFAETGPGTLLAYAPAKAREQFESYERDVVAGFLTRTDYLQVNPLTEPVTYLGGVYCSSPFAKFDLA